MKEYQLPAICSVITADHNKELLKQVVDIESLVQPYDTWNEQAIHDLIAQEHNQCWAVLNPKLTDKSKVEAIAYCIFSSVFEVAEILRVGTRPDYQRQGLAQGLIQAMIKYMANKNLERMLLEVRVDNKAAIALYRKMGFKVVHRRVDYYIDKNNGSSVSGAGCDALVMQYDRLA